MINKRLTAFFCLCVIGWSIGSIVFDPKQRYFVSYYTEDVYKNLETLYNASQYRQKYPTALIADDVVFRYAAGAYIRGVDPILVNSEHTPLGKYILGLSFLFLQNDGVVIFLCTLIAIVTMWAIGRQSLGDAFLALLPVVLFSTEELFRNQLKVRPLLDIIQLPFILLSLYSFLREFPKGKFLWTSLSLGFAAATKSIVPAILLIIVFCLFFVIRHQWKRNLQLILWLPISFGVLLLSYTRTFFNGYNLWDFFGFQKWILLYQQSKLMFPFSFWRLMLFNQWQTWWGDFAVREAEDWRLTWPLLVIIPFVLIVLYARRRVKYSDAILLLVLWVLIYEAFLSVGIVVTRFLLPLLPILYILAVQFVRELTNKKVHTS